ncbi:MAG: hypothetical protein ACTSUE_24415 [Promethearchaeota archaeon]
MSKNDTWDSWAEKLVVGLGKWSWLIVLLAACWYIWRGIWWSIFALWLVNTGRAIWNFVCAVALLVILFMYVLPKFTKQVKAKDWQGMMDDAIPFGSFKMPKMLLFGIILEIFGYYGGAGVLICSILIMLLAPVNKPGKEAGTVDSKKKPTKKSAEPAREEPAESETSEPKVFICEKCGKEYKTERGLSNHAAKCQA